MTQLKITQANQLTWEDLGRTVRLVGADGASYEGALTYLSFSPAEDNPACIAVGDNGIWGELIYLSATHLVEVEW